MTFLSIPLEDVLEMDGVMELPEDVQTATLLDWQTTAEAFLVQELFRHFQVKIFFSKRLMTDPMVRPRFKPG